MLPPSKLLLRAHLLCTSGSLQMVAPPSEQKTHVRCDHTSMGGRVDCPVAHKGPCRGPCPHARPQACAAASSTRHPLHTLAMLSPVPRLLRKLLWHIPHAHAHCHQHVHTQTSAHMRVRARRQALHHTYHEPLATVLPSLDALLAGPPVRKLLFMSSPEVGACVCADVLLFVNCICMWRMIMCAYAHAPFHEQP